MPALSRSCCRMALPSGAPKASPKVAARQTRSLILAVRAAAPPASDCNDSPNASRRAALSLALGSAAVTLGAAASATAAVSVPNEVEIVEKELNQSFDVDFGGLKVNHKDLIYGVFVGQWVALIGAFAGGWAARQRAKQVEVLNAKLLETNKSMRKQMNRDVHSSRGAEPNESQRTVMGLLKEGKGLLKKKESAQAKAVFEKALVEITSAGSQLDAPWKAERKARRGLGAAANLEGDYEEAERNLLRVCELCETMMLPGSDRPELADAYGVLADLYTSWGKFDQAGQFYDKMIDEMGSAV